MPIPLSKADPTDWLLSRDNPSVRYFTLVDLLCAPHDDPDVRQARDAILREGMVPEILSHQQEGGFWVAPDRMYTAKYKGTLWQILILAELLPGGDDPRIRRACEFILENAQDRESGGFAMHRAVRTGGGRPSEVLPCLSGNVTWSLLRLGLIDDPRIQRAIDWITTYQRFDDGDGEAPTGWPYDRYEICWGRHTCHMGVVKTLKALVAIPAERRNPAVQATLDGGAEYLLRHHVFKRSHDLSRTSRPGWLKLGFPLMYQTDILEILDLLVRLGHHDPRMQEAIDALVSKQDEQGRWSLQTTMNGHFHADIEVRGQPSRWITLRALRVLAAWGGSTT